MVGLAEGIGRKPQMNQTQSGRHGGNAAASHGIAAMTTACHELSPACVFVDCLWKLRPILLWHMLHVAIYCYENSP
jgi:hypothetical protein